MISRLAGLLVISFSMALSAVSAASERQARAVLVTDERATLSAELVAKIAQLPKKMGETFQRGDVLVELDCQVYQAERSKVAAEVELAELRYENAQYLHSLDAIGVLDVSIAQAELTQVKAQLRIASINTERCQVRAPYDGQVVQWHTRPNQIAHANQELIEIVSRELPEIEAVVPAEWLHWLQAGVDVDVALEGVNHSFSASITHLAPVIDPVSRTLLIRAQFNNSNMAVSEFLKPGMSALVTFANSVSED